jgi:hypothetical protein
MIGMEILSSDAEDPQQQQELVGASDETVVSSNVTRVDEIFITDYLELFDGVKKKACEDADDLFDSIYHDDYTDIINGKQVSKDQLKTIHDKHLSLGSRASIVQHEKGIGGCVFISYRLSNDKNDMFITSSVTIEGNKFVRARTLDASFGKFMQASDKNTCYDIGRRKQ